MREFQIFLRTGSFTRPAAVSTVIGWILNFSEVNCLTLDEERNPNREVCSSANPGQATSVKFSAVMYGISSAFDAQRNSAAV